MTSSTPRVVFNIKDNSINTITQVETLPLDKQLYMAKTQKGKSGVHYYNSFAHLEKEYGAETFNENNSTYFSNAALFAKEVIANNGIWFCRLIPTDAVKSNLVLYATVIEGADIQQYQKDATTGVRLVDADGNWIPVGDGDEPGARISFSVAPLGALETKENLVVVTSTVGSLTQRKYPLAIITSKSPSVLGDNDGFEIYYEASKNDSEDVEKIKNILYTIRPKQKEYYSSTVNILRDNYGATENTFTFLNDVINTSLNLNVGIKNLTESRYTDMYELPYEIHSYETYYKAFITSLKDFLTSDEEDSIGAIFSDTNFYGINPFTGVNPFTGIEYDLFEITNTVCKKNTVNYLRNGADGTITRANELTMVRNVLNFTTYPELEDAARYPITAVVDPGYNLITKYALIDFTEKREDVCAIIGTYQQEEDELTEAEDLSVGQALYTRMLLTQESTEYGVEACRGAIVSQSGILNTSIKNTIVPATIWVAKRLAEVYNKTYISTDLIKYPGSLNLLFKDLNWTPVRLDFKNKLWGGGINYCQYYDRTQLHYPAFRSVYPYETSKLIDFEFVYVCCFIKQIARTIGMQFTGSDEAASIRHFKIENSINNALGNMLNGKYPYEISVGQTADESAAGFIDHVYIKMAADQAMTVLKVDLVVENPNA